MQFHLQLNECAQELFSSFCSIVFFFSCAGGRVSNGRWTPACLGLGMHDLLGGFWGGASRIRSPDRDVGYPGLCLGGYSWKNKNNTKRRDRQKLASRAKCWQQVN